MKIHHFFLAMIVLHFFISIGWALSSLYGRLINPEYLMTEIDYLKSNANDLSLLTNAGFYFILKKWDSEQESA